MDHPIGEAGLGARSDRGKGLVLSGPRIRPFGDAQAKAGKKESWVVEGRETGRSTPQACWIGYCAKIASVRLNALSTAASGVIPLFMTSNIATLKTCSVATWARAGLNTS
jgi:hypothetical protein